MERRYIKALLAEVKQAESVSEPKTYRFRATSDGLDRQGEIVSANGWETDDFMRNPVFLWAHNYDQPPIGKVVALTHDENGLLADVQFDQEDEFARKIESKYARGILNAVSVGFISLDADIGKDGLVKHNSQELLEISAVPVPALADALIQRMLAQKGAIPPHTTPAADPDAAWDAGAVLREVEGREQLRLIHAWVDSEADPDLKSSYKLPHHLPNGTAVWRGVAAAMAALLGARGGVQIPDGDRRGVYNHLSRHYALWDKTPPEFKSASELASLGPDEIRGLFWHGEVDEVAQKVGRVLSKANEAKLRQAASLIGEVLAQIGDESTEEEPKALDVDLSALEALVNKEN